MASVTPGSTNPSIAFEVFDGVGVVRFNRPDKLNALLPEMVQSYLELLQEADQDPGVRVIIVTGAGRAFCAGADLNVIQEGSAALAGYLLAAGDLSPDLALRVRKPVIAAINGPAAGIGFVFAIGADIRFAAEDATMTTSFSRMGLVAEYGSAWLLQRLVGHAWASELLLSGRTVNAEEARQIGLVHRVVPTADLEAVTTDYARELVVRGSARSWEAIKGQLLADADSSADEAMRRSLALMRDSSCWGEVEEGVAAMRERRTPNFPPLAGTGN